MNQNTTPSLFRDAQLAIARDQKQLVDSKALAITIDTVLKTHRDNEAKIDGQESSANNEDKLVLLTNIETQ